MRINDKEYKYGYTHGGKFHADEVACAALLKLLIPGFKIIRGFDPPIKDPYALIFDIGNGEFDHHSLPRETRDNGVAYASFGKLWRVLWPRFNLTEKQAQQFDLNIAQPIDWADNTGRMNPLSELVTSMNPVWDNPGTGNYEFNKAVSACCTLFDAWFRKARALQRADKEVCQAISNGVNGVAVSDKYIPSSAFPDGILFTVCPSQRGGWQGLSLKQTDGVQVLFPQMWRGSQELPTGVTFCHPGGFIAAFKDKETAVQMCSELIVEAVAA